MSDIIASIFVGIAQVSVGHPFDTSIVLIQNNKKWLGLPIRNYYRGWRYPMVSSMLFNSIAFPVYERSKKYTDNNIYSGMLAGLAVCPSVFCFDVGKIKRQTNQTLKMKDVVTTPGKIATMSRELVAMPVYFGTYDYLRSKDMEIYLAGAGAGITNWTITYPIETIRNRQIAQNITITEAIKQKHIFRGYPVCALRSILVNAVNFYVYETAKKLFSSI